MVEEIWKPVKNYEGIYEVSSLGNIKSLPRKWVFHNRILKPTSDKHGYLRVALCFNKTPTTRKIHQLVAEAFLGHIPCGHKLVVNHINHIKTDNRVENLEIVTNRENTNMKHLKRTSKYTGVSWDKYSKKWQSIICVNGKNKYLGRFDSETEASMYYENALLSIYNGTEIKDNVKKKTSSYKGVYWNKSANKWMARIQFNGKEKYLGYFHIEIEASNAYQKELSKIKTK